MAIHLAMLCIIHKNYYRKKNDILELGVTVVLYFPNIIPWGYTQLFVFANNCVFSLYYTECLLMRHIVHVDFVVDRARNDQFEVVYLMVAH